MKDDAKTAEQKTSEKAENMKERLAEELNGIMAAAYADLRKKLDAALKKRKIWYFANDSIRDHEEFHDEADRNADQAIIDHFAEITDDMFNHVTPDCLWTECDIKEGK